MWPVTSVRCSGIWEGSLVGKRARWTEISMWELYSAVLQTLCRALGFSCSLLRLHCPPVTRRHWPQQRGLGSARVSWAHWPGPPPHAFCSSHPCSQLREADVIRCRQSTTKCGFPRSPRGGILQAGGEGTKAPFLRSDQLSCLCSSLGTRSRAVSVSPQ